MQWSGCRPPYLVRLLPVWRYVLLRRAGFRLAVAFGLRVLRHAYLLHLLLKLVSAACRAVLDACAVVVDCVDRIVKKLGYL